MRIFFYIVLFIFFFQPVVAQELPFNSQIFINPYYYNPAYAGFEDRPAFYVYRRQQWTGIEGAPVTTGFNFHTIFNEKINFGLHIMNDQRSILNTTRALVTFGYRASFDDDHYISFGLSGGIGSNSIDLEAVDPNDPAIIDALDNNLFLDGNAGFNYFNKGFNLGLSLPKIFKTNTISNSGFAPGEISPLNDAIFLTSYRWELSEEKFAIEPFALYYYSDALPGQFEVIGILHLMDVFWIGASYRQDYGTTGFVGLNIKDNFKFGYAYEFFNAEQANFNNGTHDIQLALIFGQKEKKKKKNPNVSLMQQRRDMLRSMGKLPSEQGQNIYQVENDPFVPPPTETETYNEDDALNDLLNEMEDEQNVQVEPQSVEDLEAPVEDDALDIFDIQFDDEPVETTVVDPIIAPVVVVESLDSEEEDALNELLREMEDEQNILADTMSFEEVEEPIEDDTLDIFDIEFDDEPVNDPTVESTIVPVVIQEPQELDEEEALISQMDDENEEEITYEDQEGLTETTSPIQITEEDAPDEYIEPTLDEEGLYIGPTTVIKGNHLLELDKGNYVAVGTFSSYRDAEDYSDAIFIKGFYTKFGYISQTKIYYVYIFQSDDLQEAKDTSERFDAIGAEFKENWVLQVQ